MNFADGIDSWNLSPRKIFDQNVRLLNYMTETYLEWGLAHVSHREGSFIKIRSQKAKNQALVEFKYLKKPTIATVRS